MDTTDEGKKRKAKEINRMGKLDRPEIKKHVVQKLAAGATHKEIGKEVEIDRSAVTRFSHREDIKSLVEQEALRLTEILPDAIDEVMRIVREMKDIPKGELKEREFAYKVVRDVLKTFKIYPTPLQSQTIINVQHGQESEEYAPEVLEILRKHTRDNEGIIDIDPEIP